MTKLFNMAALGVASALCASPIAATAQQVMRDATGIYISSKPVQQTAITPPAPATPVVPPQEKRWLPAGTLLNLTPMQEISSKHIEAGQRYKFQVVNDVVEDGIVVIRRGSTATGIITWKTGRAIGGKSGKFDVEFESVSVGGRQIQLMGTHRQEGRGNTVGALLGSIVISGRSAVMLPGQLVNAVTEEPAPY